MTVAMLLANTVAAAERRGWRRERHGAAHATPLYDAHRALGARIVEFAGWEMPVQYRGITRGAPRGARRAPGSST